MSYLSLSRIQSITKLARIRNKRNLNREAKKKIKEALVLGSRAGLGFIDIPFRKEMSIYMEREGKILLTQGYVYSLFEPFDAGDSGLYIMRVSWEGR